jgi:hypothetical protein
MKLTIELVPEPCWHNNLRSLLPKEKWDELRRKVYQDNKNQCGICGRSGKIEAHELWVYDDENRCNTQLALVILMV